MGPVQRNRPGLHYLYGWFLEVLMSAIAVRALSFAKPVNMSPDSIWIPLLGGLWVLVNVALVGLGIYVQWPATCAFLAGLMNGTLVSVIVVSLASERFRAGTTGLLGGMTLSAVRSDGSMVWKAMQSLHGFVDNLFRALGIEVTEKLHHAIEQEALYMVWTMVSVVLASLVVEWMQAARAKA
jgi:hypothetical protein